MDPGVLLRSPSGYDDRILSDPTLVTARKVVHAIGAYPTVQMENIVTDLLRGSLGPKMAQRIHDNHRRIICKHVADVRPNVDCAKGISAI